MTIQNIWAKLRGLEENGALDAALGMGGNIIWLDGYAGSDACDGSFSSPVKTLEAAYALGRDGKHDVIVIKNAGNSAALCTVRLDAALTWSKNCLHLTAQSPTHQLFSQRARIAPTSTTTAFANFITMSGCDCLWNGIQLWHGFGTGVAAAIALTLTGHRNRFDYCHIAGMADDASADDAGSRCLLIKGDEHVFENCVIGVDTVNASAANARIQFAANPTSTYGAARNIFKKCYFPFFADATTPLLIKTAAVGSMDRFQFFEECIISNMGTSTIAGLCTLNANSGGYIAFRNPRLYKGITGFGTDATARGQIYIDGVASGSTTTGIGYNPNA